MAGTPHMSPKVEDTPTSIELSVKTPDGQYEIRHFSPEAIVHFGNDERGFGGWIRLVSNRRVNVLENDIEIAKRLRTVT